MILQDLTLFDIDNEDALVDEKIPFPGSHQPRKSLIQQANEKLDVKIGLGDNFYSLHEATSMIMTRDSLGLIRESINHIRDIARLKMVNLRSMHGYRFQRADRDELDLIRLHGFIMHNFITKKRQRGIQICQDAVKFQISGAMFEKLGMVNYIN